MMYLSKFSVMHTKDIYEPPRDKTNKMACAHSENSDQPGHCAQSDQSLHCVRNG